MHESLRAVVYKIVPIKNSSTGGHLKSSHFVFRGNNFHLGKTPSYPPPPLPQDEVWSDTSSKCIIEPATNIHLGEPKIETSYTCMWLCFPVVPNRLQPLSLTIRNICNCNTTKYRYRIFFWSRCLLAVCNVCNDCKVGRLTLCHLNYLYGAIQTFEKAL